MAWETPRTNWLTGELVTANDMNRYVRDALLASGVNQISATDSLIVGSGANRVSELTVGSTGTFLVMKNGSPFWGTPVGYNTKTWTAATSLTDSQYGDNTPNYKFDEQWGTEVATVTNPGVKVKLFALVTGCCWLTKSTGALAQARIELSVDGGDTWFTKTGYHEMEFGTGQGRIPMVALAASTERTPTGNLQARVMVNSGYTYTTHNVHLQDGQLMLMAFGTT